MGYGHAVAERSSRFDSIHGDEDQAVVTAADEARIEKLAEEKLAARILEDHNGVYDLLSGIETSEIDPHLHRMLVNDAEARRALNQAFPNGMPPALEGLMIAVANVTARIRAEARTCWLDQCTDESAAEILGADA
jgi:hypothetical protein